MFDYESKYQGSAKDAPDSRDFSVEHILGTPKRKVSIPQEINLIEGNAECDNQGSTNHCTAFSLTLLHEIQNSLERAGKVDLSPKEQWENQKKYPGTAREEDGDYLQSALKSLKKYGLKFEKQILRIEGYANVAMHQIDLRLHQKFPVYTGLPVTRNNFYKAKKTGIWAGVEDTVTGGHAVCIVGKTLRGGVEFYIVANSWGKDWGYFKNGTFLVRKSDAKHFFSKYLVYDTKDISKKPEKDFYIFRDVTDKSFAAEEIRWAAENGIFRGYGGDKKPLEEKLFQPDKPISRAEVAVVLKRFYDLIKK